MLRVRLGAHYLSDSGQTSEHRVDRIIRHIDFKQTTLVSKDAETERERELKRDQEMLQKLS